MLINKRIIVGAIAVYLILPVIVPVVSTENEIKYIPSLIYDADSMEYWAVLVGIGDYPGVTSDLPYSINEIMSFKDTLLDGGNWNESNIHVLTDNDATKANIFNELEWLNSNADKNDISIFYYAGHGVQSSNNEYLAVYDELISDEELDEELDNFESRITVILDACHSGGFIEEVGKRGRVILTACRKDEETYQVFELRSGIFGYFINISLEKLTKTAETTFLFTWFFSVYYSKQLSQYYEGDYTIHPRMYDGCLGMTRIIDHHQYVQTFLYKMFPSIIENSNVNNINNRTWKM